MDDPCQCHRNFAYIAPTHSGHCCFLPPDRTCHPQEVAEWERKRDARRSHGSEPPAHRTKGGNDGN